jgi:tetratricopeptide (TPR) repeat protein
MRRLALAAVVLVAGAAGAHAEQRPPPFLTVTSYAARIAKLELWLNAVATHEAGTDDDAAIEVASWSLRDLQSLWIDASVLMQLTLNPKRAWFSVTQAGQRSQGLRFSTADLRRLRLLACVAAGRLLSDPTCRGLGPLDAALRQLADRAHLARVGGDDNYVTKRGAILHGDIAMTRRIATEPLAASPSLGPGRIRMRMNDGREIDLGQVAIHWEVARMLLDHVKPSGADHVDPASDPMVLQWYRATNAWMQANEDYDPLHLSHALTIFRADPDLLFLTACLHETYAASRVQSVLRSAVLPSGVSFDIGAERAELRQAEEFFRRAVAAKPDFGEAHLRFGRVLSQLGRPADAVKELTQALASTEDELLRYYGELFLGAVREALGELDAAGASYARAAELRPNAQSPLTALSALARRRGDRAGALREIRRVFDLTSREGDLDDPWWTYHLAQARNVHDLLEDLYRPFRSEAGR